MAGGLSHFTLEGGPDVPDTTYSVLDLRTQLGCAICGKTPIMARGWCAGHYKRWHRYGDPLKGGTDWGAAQRWLEAALTYEGDECLLWPFAADTHGVIRVNGALVQAHRELLVRATGENPPDLEACHNCGNGLCCNLAHLRWDTHAGNMADTIAHGTSTRGEKNARHKLKEPEVRRIKAVLAAGSESLTGLAARHGVTLSAISSIKHGRTWGWVK